MRIYKIIIDQFLIMNGFSDMITSTMRVKQWCPLSPTLFGMYIDDLEEFLQLHTHIEDNCLLHQI